MTGPDDLVGKRHVDTTQKHWVRACETARRDLEPIGAFAAFIGDLLEAWVDGQTELGAIAHADLTRRCKGLKVNELRIWNNIVALAHSLPRCKNTG